MTVGAFRLTFEISWLFLERLKGSIERLHDFLPRNVHDDQNTDRNQVGAHNSRTEGLFFTLLV